MIDLVGVTKKYGKTVAADNISLSLHEPGIYCLLGRNGAGKTTLMKLISGNISSTGGQVSVNGSRVTSLSMPENVRYIEAAKSQFNMRISDLFETADGLDADFDLDFAKHMADKFKLNRKKKYNSLSFGMKTMVTTVITLASNADVVMLDEPVLGFDAVMRKEFYELLLMSYESHPRIIIVSTHLIDEIENTASDIIMIENGKILLYEDINTVLEKAYKVSGQTEIVKKALEGLNVIAVDEIGKFSVAYVFDSRRPSDENVELGGLSLGDLFIKMVGGVENA